MTTLTETDRQILKTLSNGERYLGELMQQCPEIETYSQLHRILTVLEGRQLISTSRDGDRAILYSLTEQGRKSIK